MMLAMTRVSDLIERALPELLALKHDLHAHPELGFEEHETARRILDRLQPLTDLSIQTGVAKTGIVATLNADRPGPCVALRAELDALPILEQSDLPYKSTADGKMHACGHDGHMTCLVGAAGVLSQMADDLPGKVKFIFQPAEEGGGGARLMCDAGVLDEPKVDSIFALHGWPYMEQGTVGVCPGVAMASADFWQMAIRGTGAHAAYPHRGIDPVVVASHIVVALQTIASRSIDPLESVVLTVARIDAGSANNVIPESARLEGTIRALEPTVREKTIARFESIVENTAAAFGATAEIEWGDGYPLLHNDKAAVSLVADAARDIVGDQNTSADVPACLGAEDFAFFARRAPAAFWRLGVGRGDPATRPTLHQPTYEFPDEAVALGVRMHCEIALRYLNSARRFVFEPSGYRRVVTDGSKCFRAPVSNCITRPSSGSTSTICPEYS